jgi:hypothetical protein
MNVVVYVFVVILLIAVGACIALVAMRQSFTAHLDRIEAKTRKPGSAEGPRSDLPPEVLALAKRVGARVDGAPGFAVFEQSGQMWRAPGGKPMEFTARQTVRVTEPGFLWRAAMGPLRWMVVADYLVGRTGGLEVRLLGVLSVVRMVGGADAYRGEALRYLAELPWNPDAILRNRSLDWTVVTSNTISVATGVGTERGEVTFELDGNGLVVRASAASRLYVEKGRATSRPWHGRFWDYHPIAGRRMPRQGEVAWVLDAGDFVYWRGHMLNWSDSPAPRQTTE